MREYSKESADQSAEGLKQIARAYWDSSVLRTLISLGLCPLLDEGPATAAELALRISANPRFLDAFLGACVALGLLERQGECYASSEQASAFLVPGKEGYSGDYLLHLTNHWNTFGDLDRLVREGVSELPFQNGYVSVDRFWSDYMRAQHYRAVTVQARYLVRTVDLSGKRKLLDLGGGTASYSVALAAAYPELTAHVIDAKEPLAIAWEVVDEAGLAERVLLVEGDFCKMDLGHDADAVLISGVVLIKPESFCRDLYRVAYDALRPGGTLILQDFMQMPGASLERQFLGAITDLYLIAAFDPGGGDRQSDEYASWLCDVGFVDVIQHPEQPDLAIITATRA